MAENIDYNFITELERFKTKGYVPSDNSGVTIGTGVDLKSKNEDYFSELPKSIRDKLKPYFGLSGKAAKDKLAKIPLELEKSEAEQVNKITKKNEVNLLKDQWKKATGTDFDNLPSSLATPIASVAFQYGAGNPTDPKEGYPDFWAAATSGDVEGMEAELRAFRDKYPTRREAEADYMAGEQLSERVRRIRPELLPFLEKTQVGMVPMSAPETAYAEPKPRPQLASDIVETASAQPKPRPPAPTESGGISDLLSQIGSSLGFDRTPSRSTLSEQEEARFDLLLQNLKGK